MSRIYQLFGGAITITLPSNLLDVAELRQVADTQEVYVEDNSTVSFLVDITQSVPVPLKEYRAAIEYHYTNLAEENAAAESGIRSVDVQQCQVRQECHGPILLVGQQAVAKFRKGNDQAELVDVFMALWRIPTRNAEITLTVNVPHTDEQQKRSLEEYENIFKAAAESLRIEDYGLFAGSA